MIAIHYAHLVMVASQGIISSQDTHALRIALDVASQVDVRCTPEWSTQL